MATKSATKKVTKSPAKETTVVKAVVAHKKNRKFSISKLIETPGLGAVLAEFLGTFLLAGIVLATRNEPIYVMFALVGIVLSFGVISGAHVNPAVTLGAWVTKKITPLRSLAFMLAQVLGAVLAYTVFSAYVNAAGAGGAEDAFAQPAVELFTATAIPEGKEWGLFFAEVIGVTILGFAFASAYRARQNRATYALTVGFGLFVALIISGATAAYIGGGTVLNPAVAVSLQAIQFNVWAIAIYVIAPAIGGIVGYLLHDTIYNVSEISDK